MLLFLFVLRYMNVHMFASNVEVRNHLLRNSAHLVMDL